MHSDSAKSSNMACSNTADLISNAVTPNFGNFFQASSLNAPNFYFDKAHLVEKLNPKQYGDGLQHLEAQKFNSSLKLKENCPRQEPKCASKPILSKEENLPFSFGSPRGPVQGPRGKVTDNLPSSYQGKEFKSKNFDTSSTEFINKELNSKFGNQRNTKGSYCSDLAAQPSFQSFKQRKHLTTEYLHMEVEKAEYNVSMENSDYFDYDPCKAQEIREEKVSSSEQYNDNITYFPPEKQTQQTKEDTKLKSRSSIFTSKAGTQEFDYSFSQTFLPTLTPIQISPNPLICLKENPRLWEPDETLLISKKLSKNLDLLETQDNALKKNIQNDYHFNQDQIVNTDKVILGKLQNPESMELMSNSTTPSSQTGSITPTKPLGTLSLICSKSARGSDLEENFSNLTNQLKIFSIMDAFSLSMGKLGDSCTEDFILSHQKRRELNETILISQIGNMVNALTDFATSKLSVSLLSVQVTFMRQYFLLCFLCC